MNDEELEIVITARDDAQKVIETLGEHLGVFSRLALRAADAARQIGDKFRAVVSGGAARLTGFMKDLRQTTQAVTDGIAMALGPLGKFNSRLDLIQAAIQKTATRMGGWAFGEMRAFIESAEGARIAVGALVLGLGLLVRMAGDAAFAISDRLAKATDEWVHVAREMEVQQLRLTSLVLNFIEASGDASQSTEEWVEWVEHLALATGKSSKEITDLTALALDAQRVTHLNAEETQSLVEATLDFSAATGRPVQTVLQQFIQGFRGARGSLRGMTIDLTDATVAANQFADMTPDAFKRLSAEEKGVARLNELIRQLGPNLGAAARQANTMAGASAKMGEAWEQFTEKLGKGVDLIRGPAQLGFANLFVTMTQLPEGLLKTAGALTEIARIAFKLGGVLLVLGGIVVGLTGAWIALQVALKLPLAASVGEYLTSVGVAVTETTTWGQAIGLVAGNLKTALVPAWEAVAGSITGATVATAAFNLALSVSAIGIIVAGIAGLVAIFYKAVKIITETKTVSDALKETFGEFKSIGELVAKAFEVGIGALSKFIAEGAAGIVRGLARIVDAVQFLEQLWLKLLENVGAGSSAVADRVRANIDAAGKFAKELRDGADAAQHLGEEVAKATTIKKSGTTGPSDEELKQQKEILKLQIDQAKELQDITAFRKASIELAKIEMKEVQDKTGNAMQAQKTFALTRNKIERDAGEIQKKIDKDAADRAKDASTAAKEAAEAAKKHWDEQIKQQEMLADAEQARRDGEVALAEDQAKFDKERLEKTIELVQQGKASVRDALNAAQIVQNAERHTLELKKAGLEATIRTAEAEGKPLAEVQKLRTELEQINVLLGRQPQIVQDTADKLKGVGTFGLGSMFKDSIMEVGDALVAGTRPIGETLQGIGLSWGKQLFGNMLDEKLKGFDPQMKKNFLDYIPGIFDQSGEVVTDISKQTYKDVANTVTPCIDAVDEAGRTATEAGKAISDAGTTAKGGWGDFFDFLLNTARSVFGLIESLISKIFGGGGGGGLLGSAVGLFKGLVSGGGVNSQGGGGLLGDAVDLVGGLFHLGGSTGLTSGLFKGGGFLSGATDWFKSTGVGQAFTSLTTTLRPVIDIFTSLGNVAGGVLGALTLFNKNSSGFQKVLGGLGLVNGVQSLGSLLYTQGGNLANSAFGFTTESELLSQLFGQGGRGIIGEIVHTVVSQVASQTTANAASQVGTQIGAQLSDLLGPVAAVAAVALGARGIAQSRSQLNKVSLGDQTTVGTSTALQGSTLAIGTIAGFLAGGPVGAAIGAAVTAIVNSSVSSTLSKSIAKGTAEGITKSQLADKINEGLKPGTSLTGIISGLAATLNPLGAIIGAIAGTHSSLPIPGSVATPDIERIYDKLFQQILQKALGRDFSRNRNDFFGQGVGAAGRESLRNFGRGGPLRGDAQSAVMLLSGLMGSGTENWSRLRRFFNILTNGLATSQKSTEELEAAIYKLVRHGVGNLVQGLTSVNQLFEGGAKAAARTRKETDLVARAFQAKLPFDITDLVTKNQRDTGGVNVRAFRQDVQMRALQLAIDGTIELTKKLVKQLGDVFLDLARKLSEKVSPALDVLDLALQVATDGGRKLGRELRKAIDIQHALTEAEVTRLSKEQAANLAEQIIEQQRGLGPKARRKEQQLAIAEVIGKQAIADFIKTATLQATGQPEQAALFAANKAFDKASVDVFDAIDKAEHAKKGKNRKQALEDLRSAENAAIQAVTDWGNAILGLLDKLRQLTIGSEDYGLKLDEEIDGLRKATDTAGKYDKAILAANKRLHDATSATAKMDALARVMDLLRAKASAAITDIQEALDAQIKPMQEELDKISPLAGLADGLKDQRDEIARGNGGIVTLAAIQRDLMEQLQTFRTTDGEDQAKAASRISALISQSLQAGQGIFSAGSARMTALQQQALDILDEVGGAAMDAQERQTELTEQIKDATDKAQKDIEKIQKDLADQLEFLKAAMVQFQAEAAAELRQQLKDLLPPGTDIDKLLADPQVAQLVVLQLQLDKLEEIRLAIEGVSETDTNNTPQQNAPNGNYPLTSTQSAGGNQPTPVVIALNVNVTPATGSSPEAELYGKTAANAMQKDLVALLMRLGVITGNQLVT